MKILMVNTFDISGGAARAANRLHKAVLKQNVDSKMLVQIKKSDDAFVISKNKLSQSISRYRFILDSIPARFYKKRIKLLFSPSQLSSKNIINKINKINPDIVHLHWICAGMIKIEDLAKIKSPIVWTLHDNWAFTGGCHIMWDCKRYQEKCGKCPMLKSEKDDDLSGIVFNRKKEAFSKLKDLTIVGVSNWLTNCSKNSSLLKNRKHITLPNPLDTLKFGLHDKNESRNTFTLPQDKKLVLFGAMNAIRDVNKGFKELCKALNQLDPKNMDLVVFGGVEANIYNNLGFNVHHIGHVENDKSLVDLYNAADVMVVPSLQEAFGQTASESMSCGTPVVAFGHTGLLDIVDHEKNGYLASPFDTKDLANGIEWVLNNKNYDLLCKNAREKVVKNFDSRVVAKKYIELYESILAE